MHGLHRQWGWMVFAIFIAGCSGSGNSGDPVGTSPPPAGTTDSGCTGSCANADSFLSVADVQKVIAQAVNEAQAQNQPATIAVVDRVGNVLGVYRMTGARTTVTISSGRGVQGGLENIAIIPSELAAISKAVTGAYLSSEGNAFSTRTASQIVQEHFNPGEFGGPSGPLFGTQFSQFLCSDVINLPAPVLAGLFAPGSNVGVGPKSAPLGLSADPGGFRYTRAAHRWAALAWSPMATTASI
ncbi:MAG: heme-binding protein [Rhodanobacteraceae bacterium]|nr:heme-binding protein [Rhodanobacteraceae bacterium]